MTRRKGLAAVGGGSLGAALLAACGGGTTTGLKFDDAATAREPGTVWFTKNDWKLADETKQAIAGGIYRGYQTGDQPGHMDPLSQGPATTLVSDHTHELLMFRNRGPGIDPKSTEASRPVGALAENWEVSADGLTVTFSMRQGVKWHPIPPVNGRVMDIEDWKTTIDRFLEVSPYRSTMLEILDKVEFPDQRRMVWRLQAPYAPLFDQIWSPFFAYSVMPKELNANPSLAQNTPIGTGYKILDRYDRAITFEYRKHKDYWGGEPFIDRWHAPIIPEYANRYSQFVSGNIMDFTPTAREVLLLAKDAPNAVIVANEIPYDVASRMRFGRQSPQNWPWADPRVRIAIRRSIDYKSIGEFLSNKEQFEAAGIDIEISPMSHLPQDPGYWLNPEKGELGKLSENYLYDPAEALKLTAAAGHRDPIVIPFYILLQAGEIAQEEQLVIDSLDRSSAIKLQVNRVASRPEHDRYRLYGEYDGLIPQGGSSHDPDYFITRDYHSKGRPATELQNVYPDARIDSIAEAQRRELDIDKRRQLLKDFQLLEAELMQGIPGRHLFTNFQFRWPWLRNINYGEAGSPPAGRPVGGGHLHWLDPEMPNRERG
jgi:ABC-type transport system substrate-binding protein